MPSILRKLQSKVRRHLSDLHQRRHDKLSAQSSIKDGSAASARSSVIANEWSTAPNGSRVSSCQTTGSLDQQPRQNTSLSASTACEDPSVQPSADGIVCNTISTAAAPSEVEIAASQTRSVEVVPDASDLWSKAYQEAVQNMGQDVDVAILKGENIAQLLKDLESFDKDATDESLFLRGVKYLRSIRVPLDRFKLALDLTAPLTAVEPTTSVVFGVVRGVTAVAISMSTADLDFAKKIGEMLEQISYIDDCDTLGQREDRSDIHKALVSVYQKLLEFYVTAYTLLCKRRTELVLAVIADTGTLPDIVKDFLKHAEHLRKTVEKATLDIVQDIKTMLYDEKISQWLGHDKLSQQSRHHAELRALRADTACEFLLEKSDFKRWYGASDPQQLAILGDVGSGKTVMMSFLIDELCKRRSHHLPQPRILYHYCQNDETGHGIHIFSSLILSLLEQCVGLKKTFYDWYRRDLLTGNFEPSTSVHKLAAFFQTAVRGLDRPVYLVLDGLDECDTGSRNILLGALRQLSQDIPGLKVILSSRPWEEVLNQLYGMPAIDLGTDSGRDRIIVEKTVETKLGSLAPEVKQLVIERLAGLAQGSAIWTKITVEVIASKKIRALSRMKRYLDDMPQPEGLSSLYRSLFFRCAGEEPEAQNMAAAALEILGAARRRLSILELAWAVATRTAEPEVTTVAGIAELVDHQGVMALIQPFVAAVDFSDLKKRQIILVHQSAKEFVMSDLASIRSGLLYAANHPSTAVKSPPQLPNPCTLENNIFNICLRYLLLDDIDQLSLLSVEQMAINELPQNLDLFTDESDAANYTTNCSWEAWEEGMIRYDPADRGFGEFFVYASSQWMTHFGSVAAAPLPDLKSVEKVCQAKSVRLRNWASQSCRPDCVVQARYEFDGSLYDPLSITSLYGSQGMLLKMLDSSDLESDSFLPNSALLAVDQLLQWGDLSRLRTLFLGPVTGRHLQNLTFFRHVLDSWRFCNNNYSNWDAAFAIIDDIPDLLVREGWGLDLLCLAAQRGCLPLIKGLMDNARVSTSLRVELFRAPNGQSRSSPRLTNLSIGEAVIADHVAVVEYLLQQEGIQTHLHHRNGNGENVLHMASTHCNPAMFALLTSHFPSGAYQRDSQGRTPLMRLAQDSPFSQRRVDSARRLLSIRASHGGVIASEDVQEALCAAEQTQDNEMCNVLTTYIHG